MLVEEVLEGLLTLVLKLVNGDRAKAKSQLDSLAVKLANAAADAAEAAKFGSESQKPV